MSAIDDAVRANESYRAQLSGGHLPAPPARKLAVLTCMDTRLDLDQMLGLNPGDAHVIRNAGGIVTGDALRSLIISHYLLGTQELMIINHTDCAMLTFRDEDLLDRLRKKTGTSTIGPAVFHAFSNVEDNVRQQMQKLRSHPWITQEIPIRGFIYDVTTGRLREVASAEAHRSTA